MGKQMLVVANTVEKSKKGSRNMALAVSNGTTLARYAKRTGVSDDRKFAGKKWLPGEKQGVFRWGDLVVGLEICADHYGKKLASENHPALDLYVVPAHVRGSGLNEEALPSGLNGVALFCNGGPGEYAGKVEALQRFSGCTTKRFQNRTTHQPSRKNPLRLSVYAVDLESPF
jgi:hypothetical protein